MEVSVAYADSQHQYWLHIDVPDDSTVSAAIEQSGILNRVPDINLGKQKVGIFGKVTRLDATIKSGDRIEIYQPIIADPKTVRRRKQDDDDDDDE